MSNNRGMDKQNVVYPHNGILFSNKKNEVWIHAMPWTNPENSMLSERSQTQKATHHRILCI